MDELEWMEVFELKKGEAPTLNAEIDKTDKEIDNMVYELYGWSFSLLLKLVVELPTYNTLLLPPLYLE